MNRFEAIAAKIKSLSPLVREIAVVEEAGVLCAYVYPDFGEASKQGIVNLSAEIRWYAVELYNMHAPGDAKVRSYYVLPVPLPKGESGGIDRESLERFRLQQSEPRPYEPDIDDELYLALKHYVERLTDQPVYPSSHFEFDLALDSLDHVELLAYMDESFGVEVHDKEFAAMMTTGALYRYLKAHRTKCEPRRVVWSKLLRSKGWMRLHRSPWIMTLYRCLALLLFKLYFRLSVSGEKNIPDSPCIIAPSHQSMLDGFIIGAALPGGVLRRTFTLAFELVFGRGMMRPVARFGQLVLIDVNNDLKASMQKAAVPLIQGYNLVIFPEGARTRDRELLEFRPFFAMLAKEFNVPIVPTVLDGTFEALRAGMLFPRPAKVVVKYLDPVYPRDDESAEMLSARVKRAIKQEMAAHPFL